MLTFHRDKIPISQGYTDEKCIQKPWEKIKQNLAILTCKYQAGRRAEYDYSVAVSSLEKGSRNCHMLELKELEGKMGTYCSLLFRTNKF